ncbi:MAG: hypothetical protein WC264_03190 [Candidatus Paceibacterota bacterium]|jgi:hypothetical protein
MVQIIKNYLKERNTKKQILNQISEKFESKEIFNLFFQIKSKSNLQNTDDSILKVFKSNKEIILLKINDIKNKNKTKKVVIEKSFEIIENEYKHYKEVYRELNASKPQYFSFKGENKTVCFLISEKDHSLLENFVFNIFQYDIFVHAKRDHGEHVSGCIISSKKDKKLLEKLLQHLDHQWEFDNNEIKSTPYKITKISWKGLQKLFVSLPVTV